MTILLPQQIFLLESIFHQACGLWVSAKSGGWPPREWLPALGNIRPGCQEHFWGGALFGPHLEGELGLGQQGHWMRSKAASLGSKKATPLGLTPPYFTCDKSGG